MSSPKSSLTMRERLHDPLWDGVHFWTLAAGAFLGLIILTLFAQTLSYEVQNIPEVLKMVLPWKLSDVRPEPWEHILFVTGIVLVPITSVIWFGLCSAWWRRRNTDAPLAFFQSAGMAGLFCVGWLMILTTLHPALRSTEAWEALHPWEALLPRTAGLWILTLLGAVVSWVLLKFGERIPGQERWLLIMEIVAVGLVMSWLAFDPISLIHAVPKGSGDSDWFLSSFHDVLGGKHLLLESQSQYGLLLFYLLAPYFWIVGLGSEQFTILMMIIHAFYYTGLYVLLRILLPRRTEAVLAFVFILGMSLFRNELRSEMYGEPSITRLRNVFDIPLLLCWAMECRTGGKRWYVAAAALAGIAAFYNADVGIALALSSAVFAIAVPLVKENALGRIIKSIALRLGVLIASIALVAFLFSLFLFLRTGQWPPLSHFLSDAALYAAGFGALPMPLLGVYWAVLGTYLAMILAVVVAWCGNRQWRTAPFILGLTAYGVISFAYYLNRSFVSNIWVIAMPAALGFATLASTYSERLHRAAYRDSLIHPLLRWLISALCLLGLGTAIAFDIAGVQAMASRRYGTNRPPLPEHDLVWEETLTKSITAIQSRVPSGKRAAVLSCRDGLFTLQSDRVNAFGYPLLLTVFTLPRLEEILNRFVRQQHPYLFVDQDRGHCPAADAVLQALEPFYDKQGSEGVFDIYTRRREPVAPVVY